MSIKEFIEAAIDGGWKNNVVWFTAEERSKMILMQGARDIAFIMLDPKAWEAVGKVKGWAESKFYSHDGIHATGVTMSEAQWHFRCMGNALWEGKTLEEYIATL